MPADASDVPPVRRLDPLPDWLARPWVHEIVRAVGNGRFVGGAVRDTLLRRPVGDLDLATPSRPETVVTALRQAGLKALPTGLAHGTVTAVADGGTIEITTLRRDVETDGRHAIVAFTDDWRADAERRDLTMNALYLAPDGSLYDPLGTALDDCLAGRVRFVGDPALRIDEDVLRLLRFYRFQATHGLGPADPVARAACRSRAPDLTRLPGERIRVELMKLLAAPAPADTLALLVEDRVAPVILPAPLALDRLARLVTIDQPGDPLLRLASLLTADQVADPRLAALRLSNRERLRLDMLLADQPDCAPAAPRAVHRRALYRLGRAGWADRVRLAAAARDPVPSLESLFDAARFWEPPAFPLNGHDAHAVGIAEGPAVGAALAAVETWWVEADFAPDRAACLAILAELRENCPAIMHPNDEDS